MHSTTHTGDAQCQQASTSVICAFLLLLKGRSRLPPAVQLVKKTTTTKKLEHNDFTVSKQNVATDVLFWRKDHKKSNYHVQGNRTSATTRNRGGEKKQKNKNHSGGELTGDGAEVEVVPDDLLQLVVHRALLEAQVEVVAQVLVYHAPWRRKTKGA